MQSNIKNLSFEVKLELFEGPFDLLLFFIERDELDIYDIPISSVTSEFLKYIKHLEKLDIDLASEFILVAATLMKIKSRMMLPRPEFDEEGNEIDPREDLVKHLLEYKRYKEIVKELVELEDNRSQKKHRGNISKELKSIATENNVEYELQDLDLFKLLKVYGRLLEKYEINKNESKIHSIVKYPYTVDSKKKYILQETLKKGKLSFEKILLESSDKVEVIFNFLAILELIQLKLITISIGLGYNNFWIEKNSENELE